MDNAKMTTTERSILRVFEEELEVTVMSLPFPMSPIERGKRIEVARERAARLANALFHAFTVPTTEVRNRVASAANLFAEALQELRT